MLFLFFFFFKQKTAYEMRISDWSSDVCSSDLGGIYVVKSEKIVVFIRFFRWYFTLGYFAEQAVVAHEGLIDDVRIGAGWPFRSGRIRLRGVPVPPTPVRAAVRSGLEPRPEEGRVGEECVSQCSTGGSPEH